jgi:2-dehydro-3-deoxyglucarate aldolase/4-hydroxy-2-oxoheptanedioate aldolase
LQKVATAALDHKKPCGILVRTAEDIAKVKALGYTWLAIDSDLALLRDGFVRNVAAAKL